MEGKPFKIPRRTALLELDIPGWEEATIRCAFDIPMGMFFEFERLTDTEDMSKLETAVRRFADDMIIDWNLTDEAGNELTPDAEGIMHIPLAIAAAMLRAWKTAMLEVPAPLEEPSNNGATSAEELTPAVEPSASQSS